MQFNQIGNPTYIALETFRKSGVGVPTPVWAVAEQGKLYVWTVGESGKVKRMRNNPKVRIAVSDARGTPKSEWVEAKARVLDDPSDEAAQRKRLAAKYGWQFRLFALMGKLRGGNSSSHVAIELSQI
ncbi:MAG: PPOX class F420-dependent oxidoreductase [Caldilineaceae bacterium]|nr:PPOX class F420-dependent oxidoreductase [Caldilineaceae bacterium]MBP8109987.1 PPOX class F420-dependent oxidoreductase [Caldilineaceae bacterium]MBP8125150.1 PPOX class F420-dependent oxidoreductase [Caldilineaceae bacterium]MBP9072102.1 PPOX class F420-dependent oxidoreductase [Caldilineaceae bacterium]